MGKGMKGVRGHAERARERIRATALIDRVRAYALSEPDPFRPERIDPDTGERVRCKLADADVPCRMTTNQVRAALGLIGKVVPDVKAVEVHAMQTVRHLVELSNAELERIVAAGELPQRLDAAMALRPPENAPAPIEGQVLPHPTARETSPESEDDTASQG